MLACYSLTSRLKHIPWTEHVAWVARWRQGHQHLVTLLVELVVHLSEATSGARVPTAIVSVFDGTVVGAVELATNIVALFPHVQLSRGTLEEAT